MIRKLTIMGRNYIVTRSADLPDDAAGDVDPISEEIRIHPDVSDVRAAEVLLHEIIHVLSDDLQLGLDERQVHALGVGLADTLTRNGMLVLRCPVDGLRDAADANRAHYEGKVEND